MHSTLRSITRVIAVAALAASAVAVLASPAAADEPPPSPGPCTFAVSPNPVDSFPADVTVTGTAPSGVTVTVFVNGAADGSAVADANGQFGIPVHLTAASDISVNYTFGNKNAYSTGCAGPGGATVVRVSAQEAQRAQQLAFTGANNTPSFILIGVAALIVGIVLTVGARRRGRVNV